jgi:hypothetical protein|nr:MAG TPA: baseplate wedge protein [Bacteriophage sp.]DAS48236.1 MAG TPA: baseplate wedge protein [Caudoviricetes sp.]DAU66600.1 MAG TPA: baseplate wedge protein [Caudoviricetes sp.]
MHKPSLIKTEITQSFTSRQDKISRYSKLKRLVNLNGDTYIETPNKFTIEESNRDIYYSVEKGFEDRLDLISNKFYGTPLMYWAIAVMNHIDNPLDVPVGVVLRIPAIESIYDTGVIQI